jgi:hypothetical protein
VAQDTQIFCGCRPTGLCLTIIRVPVGAFELAGSDGVRLVAEEHADALPGRVLQRGGGYAVVEWHEEPAHRPPRRHSRRDPGAVE